MCDVFYDDIKSAKIEKDVEYAFTKALNKYFDNIQVEHPCLCDGFIDTKTKEGKVLKLIAEYKYDEQFVNKIVRAKVITQVLFYIKQFELSGRSIPNIGLIGDKNECFVFHTNPLIHYLDSDDIDWSIAPSAASNRYPQLVMSIADDPNINPFVFDINDSFQFKIIFEKINDLANNIQKFIHITEHNISQAYEVYLNKVIRKNNLQSNQIVESFLGTLTDKQRYYQHPTKKSVLVIPNGEVPINDDVFKSFFTYFKKDYSPQEKKQLSNIADRLLEDTQRRKSGDFWTPTVFVDYAHKIISEQLGDDWREKYVVYDCCCGGKALTRDYHFKELYCSTLFQSELEISSKYNREGMSFQFDFLNDYFPYKNELFKGECKVPSQLLDALNNNKPIIFFLNPPYATACNMGNGANKEKGLNITLVKQEMKQIKDVSAAMENLQHQFMFRILRLKQEYNLTNCHIALFSNPIWLTGQKAKGFLDLWCRNFEYKDGIIFQASHFADVSDAWGVTFNLWSVGKTDDNRNFIHSIVEKNSEGELYSNSKKTLYCIDKVNDLASNWVREEIKKVKTIDLPNLTSGVNVKDTENGTRGRGIKDALGYFLNAGNNLVGNAKGVALFSLPYSGANGFSIIPENFTKVMGLFTARALITSNWVTDKDEYMKPNINHPEYNQWLLDCVIFALFNSKSNQSSLRNILYKGKKWDIKNEFFFMSKEEIMELANEYNNDDCYLDATISDNRFVYKFIEQHKEQFSKDAWDVYEKACELMRKSFNCRQLFNSEHPEYQVNNFDASWYQIKPILKEYFSKDLKDFGGLYKDLSERMKPLIYELGYLKN